MGTAALSCRLLLDNSAWMRIVGPSIPDARADALAGEFGQERFLACLPFMLEAGYSARSAGGHDDLFDELASLDFLEVDLEVERRALGAQAQLARVGHHRVPPVALMIAALAASHGVGVLHYDSDYDVILERTDLDFDSAWLMPAGSLN
jgi:predicted nucleic acid-binding protein